MLHTHKLTLTSALLLALFMPEAIAAEGATQVRRPRTPDVGFGITHELQALAREFGKEGEENVVADKKRRLPTAQEWQALDQADRKKAIIDTFAQGSDAFFKRADEGLVIFDVKVEGDLPAEDAAFLLKNLRGTTIKVSHTAAYKAAIAPLKTVKEEDSRFQRDDLEYTWAIVGDLAVLHVESTDKLSLPQFAANTPFGHWIGSITGDGTNPKELNFDLPWESATDAGTITLTPSKPGLDLLAARRSGTPTIISGTVNLSGAPVPDGGTVSVGIQSAEIGKDGAWSLSAPADYDYTLVYQVPGFEPFENKVRNLDPLSGKLVAPEVPLKATRHVAFNISKRPAGGGEWTAPSIANINLYGGDQMSIRHGNVKLETIGDAIWNDGTVKLLMMPPGNKVMSMGGPKGNLLLIETTVPVVMAATVPKGGDLDLGKLTPLAIKKTDFGIQSSARSFIEEGKLTGKTLLLWVSETAPTNTVSGNSMFGQAELAPDENCSIYRLELAE